MSVSLQPPNFGYVASVVTTDKSIVVTVSEPVAYRKKDGDWVDTYSMRTVRLAADDLSARDWRDLGRNIAVLLLSDLSEPDPSRRARTLKIVRDTDGRPLRRP